MKQYQKVDVEYEEYIEVIFGHITKRYDETIQGGEAYEINTN